MQPYPTQVPCVGEVDHHVQVRDSRTLVTIKSNPDLGDCLQLEILISLTNYCILSRISIIQTSAEIIYNIRFRIGFLKY